MSQELLSDHRKSSQRGTTMASDRRQIVSKIRAEVEGQFAILRRSAYIAV